MPLRDDPNAVKLKAWMESDPDAQTFTGLRVLGRLSGVRFKDGEFMLELTTNYPQAHYWLVNGLPHPEETARALCPNSYVAVTVDAGAQKGSATVTALDAH